MRIISLIHLLLSGLFLHLNCSTQPWCAKEMEKLLSVKDEDLTAARIVSVMEAASELSCGDQALTC